MAASTTVVERLVAQIYVQVDGRNLSDELEDDLMVATIESSVHLPDMLTMQVRNEDLKWTEKEVFKAGQALEISMGDAELKRQVFVGEVTAVELNLDISGEVLLYVTAYDRAHRLHRGRFTRVFKDTKDSDIAGKIASELSLSKKLVATREVHDYVLQNNQTNWEFLQERAARIGFELQVRDKTLHFGPPPSDSAEPVNLDWKVELLAFRARMTTGEQVNSVQVRGWDPINKKGVVGTASRPQGTPEIGIGKSGGAVAQNAFHQKAELVIAREPVYNTAQAEALAQAALDDLASAFVMAEGIVLGNPRLRLGSEVKLASVGKQFTGKYVVTELRHVYEAGGYRIHFKVTGRRSTDIASITGPPAERPFNILTGVVTNNKDPEDLGRVKVKMATLGDDIESNWCRLVNPGTGSGRGVQYLPEVEDELLLLGPDINHLYALGGLWSKKDRPPTKASDALNGGKVVQRVIRSRTGHEILLDDSDNGGGITIVDSKGKNKLFIDTSTDNILIHADGDIEITAGGNLKLTAGTKISIEAGTEFEVKAGTSAKIDAKTQLELKGAATAKLQSSGQTEIKGSLVNIGQ